MKNPFKRQNVEVRVTVVNYGRMGWQNLGEMTIEKATDDYPEAKLFVEPGKAQQFVSSMRKR